MGELRVEQLSVVYRADHGDVRAVNDVSFTLPPGRSLGIVGESGCGKTSLGLALLRILPSEGRIHRGQIYFDGSDVLQLNESAFRRQIRWSKLAMVFQGAMHALNPVLRIGHQIAEAILAHESVSKAVANKRARDLLRVVGLAPGSERRYPHELSGGMRQRVMIAMALACNPDILIADEPTTALDTLMQAQILHELNALRRRFGLSLILISHDLSVIAHTCDDIAVMCDGQFVEQGPVRDVLRRPQHPYTRTLVHAFKQIGEFLPRSDSQPSSAAPDHLQSSISDTPIKQDTLLEVKALHKHFPQRRDLRQRLRGEAALVRAVDGVDLTLHRGEILGLVGESGSGKTTLGRTILRLEEPTSGSITFQGTDLTALPSAELRRKRRYMQMMFQDPYASMNPLFNVFDTVCEPLRIQRREMSVHEQRVRVIEALQDAGFKSPEVWLRRYPSELSGGERQRVALARALVADPKFLVADEPVSMLDVSVRGEVIQSLVTSVRKRGLTLLFITHDLALARRVCDNIAVMYRGKIIEQAPAAALFQRPLHPYTEALFDAALSLDPENESASS